MRHDGKHHEQQVIGCSRHRVSRGEILLNGACSAAKFVVEGAGEDYDAPDIEPNRKSRLAQSEPMPETSREGIVEIS